MKFLRWGFCGLAVILASQVFAAETAANFPKPDSDSLWRLGVVYAQIKQFYVEQTTDRELFDAAIAGMLSKLDPHSQYLDKKDYQALKDMTDGQFGGIGAKLTNDHGVLKIISPLDGTPAAKAHLASGDYIIAVDHVPILDNDEVDDAIDKIRGKPGTKVTLTIASKKNPEPKDIILTREIIHVNSVDYRLIDQHYGYIRIAEFQKATGDKVKSAIKDLMKQSQGHLNGVVLDLRNDPGGLIDSAITVADDFLDDKTASKKSVIVSTRGRFKEADFTYYAEPQNLLTGIPVVVLINPGSASASEIVAGALQDLHRAMIVGQRSFGKGSVQTVFPLDDHTAIKLTIARYYTPSGHSIQDEGIEPDILIPDLILQPPKDNDLAFFDNLREKNLKNHLTNKDAKNIDQDQLAAARKLATDDYALYEAVNIVKVLHWNE